MSEGILSQAEIDALLTDSTPVENNHNQEIDDSEILDDVEKDALGEISNISMGTAATTLSSLLGKKVEITTPKVGLTTKGELKGQYPKPYVVVDVKYSQGLIGSNILIINLKDAGIIVDLMMGGDGANPSTELSEIHLSAVGEAMNQMMGSSATSMSTVLDKRIDISPPVTNLINPKEEDIGFSEKDENETIIKVSFKMVIPGLIDSELVQLIPLEFGKDMVKELFKTLETSSNIVEEAISNTVSAELTPEAYPDFSEKQVEPKKVSEQIVTVKPAHFAQLNPQGYEQKNPQNLDLILDVPLQISVELGRTNKTIKEILEYSTGSIIELNKLAGEPVDMLVNGKLFAKGEVVVIDENFGVRITDIISPIDRIKNLQ